MAFIIWDALEDVPESLRDKVTKTEDGKFKLDASGVLGKNEELLGELKKNKAEQAKLLKKLEAMGDLDPEEARAALAERERLENEKKLAAGKFDELKQELINKHTKDIEKEREKTKGVLSALERNLIDAALTGAIAKHKGSPALLLPALRKSVKMVEEDGEYKAVVVDSKGNPRLADSKGNYMTLENLVEEAKSDKEYGRAFEASGASGSGASAAAASGSGSGADGFKRGEGGVVILTREQAKNPATYREAMALAKSPDKIQIESPAQ